MLIKPRPWGYKVSFRVKTQQQRKTLLLLKLISHYSHIGKPQWVCWWEPSYCIPECFSSLSRVWCLSLGVGGVLLWCMWECLFSFLFSCMSLALWALRRQTYKSIMLMRKEYTKWGITSMVKTWNNKVFVLNSLKPRGMKRCVKQLWSQVTEKKGKLLKWIESSMEAQRGKANNPFLVALHNALGQGTSERKRATVLVEQKYEAKNTQKVRLKSTESQKERNWQSVYGLRESYTQTENGPEARSAHSCPQTEWSSNRAFRLQHKDVANVRILSTHWSAEQSPLKTHWP